VKRFAMAVLLVSCSSDPVRDRAIDSLGEEAAGVAPGPDHRPGQPCVLCHSPGGPAQSSFSTAGTVFETSTSLKGVKGIEVNLIDSERQTPTPLGRRAILTSQSGNFFVREEEWSRMKYPFRVRLISSIDGTAQSMESHIGQEASCAGCHRDPKNPRSAYERSAFVGHIYMKR
jgi:hypothetical protein